MKLGVQGVVMLVALVTSTVVASSQSASDEVSIEIKAPGKNLFAEAGVPQLIVLDAVNEADHSLRLDVDVNLQVSQPFRSVASPDDVSIAYPPTLHFEARETKSLPLVVHPKLEAVNRAYELRFNITDSESGTVVARHFETIAVTSTPSPAQATLHLHRQAEFGPKLVAPVPDSTPCLTNFNDWCGSTWLSALEDDPDDDGSQVYASQFRAATNEIVVDFRFQTNKGFSRPWSLDPEAAAVARLEFSSDIPLPDARIDVAWLRQWDDQRVLSGVSSVSIDDQAEAVDVPLEVRHADGEFAMDDVPDLFVIRVAANQQALEEAVAAGSPSGIRLHLDESWLDLPMRAAALEWRDADLDDGLWAQPTPHARLEMTPGDSILVNLTMFNQGRPRDVDIQASHPTGWRVEAAPASNYALQSGATARIGLVVTAPQGSVHGDQGLINVTVRDAQTGNALHEARLRVTVREDAQAWWTAFVPDAETAGAALDVPSAASGVPGPGLLIATLAVAFLAGALRRRPSH